MGNQDISKTYHENGNVASVTGENISERYYPDGQPIWQFGDGQAYINPKFFSFVRIGAKSDANDIHWEDEKKLDPSKKTIICIGGSATKNAKEANGYLYRITDSLGISREDTKQMQLCSLYLHDEPDKANLLLDMLKSQDKSYEWQYQKDYKRELLAKVMPFMASVDGEGLVKLPKEKLLDKMKNLMIYTHCYGSNQLELTAKVLSNTLKSLNYNQDEVAQAMSKIVVMDNNSQRSFKQELPFTTFQRYSCLDGQNERAYTEDKKDPSIPDFIKNSKNKFNNSEGKNGALFIQSENQALFVFDSVLKDTHQAKEHSDAFFRGDENLFSEVGRKQLQLFRGVTQLWLKSAEFSNIEEFLNSATTTSELKDFMQTSKEEGEKIATIMKKNKAVNIKATYKANEL